MEELRKAPWPGWETVQLIGRGSFGAVYEIRRELVDGTTESAAMKVITIPQNPEDISEMYGEGYDDESITASFRAHLKSIVAEYTLMRKLDGSANAVNCKDISYVQHPDGIGWDIYIRMELLTPLVKSLSGSTSEETVLKIGRDICSALVLCKKYDIVHRDIKPQNIFISPNGDYKLGDFGIAKTVEKTMGGTKVGTYKYMAPEVYNNQPYGSGADIYSLGLVLYWLLNERRMPFMPLPPAKVLAGQDEEARQRRLSGEPLPPPAHGSAELKKIVLKACAYAPEARFRSAEEMYEALCRCSHIPASAEQKPADRQQEVPDPSPLAPPPPVFEPTVIDNTSAEPEPAVHANDPKQRQQVPVQQGHVQKKEEAKKEPPEKKQKKPAGRGITAIITGILLLSCCVLGIYGYMHCWFGHVWQAADCTTGRVCTRCSAIAEEPLGHLWQDATCTTPKTCSRCGAAEGKALGHKWEAATCTTKMTCKKCGQTSGAALGHKWKAATYDAPQTCTVCGATTGTALKDELTSWKEGNWTWSLKNGVLTISGKGNMGNFELYKSPWYNQHDTITRVVVEEGITGIGVYAFFDCVNISSISFPHSLRFIRECAFWFNDKLKTVEIPEGVIYIGESAFHQCTALESISIPASLAVLDGNPFIYCFALTQINISRDNPYFKFVDGVLFSKDMKTLLCYLPKNGDSVYSIPNSVERIADAAFIQCENLTSVVIPEGVTSIGSNAFVYSFGLTNVWIPKSVSLIEGSAFFCCNSLTNIYYAGSKDQWNRLIGNGYADMPSNCTVHYGS